MQTTILLPATPADLESVLRGVLAGRFPEALHGSSPPLVALPPLTPALRAHAARVAAPTPIAR